MLADSYDSWAEPANPGNRHHAMRHHALAETDAAAASDFGDKPYEVSGSDIFGIIDFVMR